MRVKVETGTSSPLGVLIFRSSSGPTRGAVLVADLRDDLVAPLEEVEAIDVAAAEQRAELPPDAGEIETEIGDLLAVDHDAGLGKIDLEVRVDVEELAALEACADHRADRLEHLLGRRVALQHHLDVVLPGCRQRRVEPREDAHAGDLRDGAVDRAVHLLGRALALLPILGEHAAERAPVGGERPHELRLGEGLDRLHHVARGSVGGRERGVGRRFHEEADVALVLDRRELALGHGVQRPCRHGDEQRRGDDRRAHRQRAVEQVLVPATHRVERVIHQSRETSLVAALVHEARAHHRRERHGDDAGEHHRRGERDRELEEQRAGETALESDRGVHRGQRDGHRDDRSDELAGADDRRLHARLPLADVSLDVLDHDDRVVDDESDRQHDGEDRQQVEAEARRVHHQRRADERDGHRDERHERRAQRSHEEEHDEADDDDRLGQRLRDLLQRVLHEGRRVVREMHLDVRRQRRRDARHLGLQAMGDVDLVHADQRPHAEVHGLLLAVLGDHVGLFGAQLHLRHVAQPHDGAGAVGDDEVLELLHRAQVGVGEQVDLDEVALRLADGGEVVVSPQRRLHVARRETERREPVGIDPDAHRELACALEAHALHARHRGELRLERAREPVGDRRDVALARREAEVERGVRPVGALHLHHRRLGVRRQFRPHLLQPRRHLGERRGAAVVELQVHRHRAHAGAARGLDVVHATDGRDGALDRRREESAHRLGAGAEVDRRDDDRRALDLGILLHRQRRERAPPHQHDDEVDDDREDRMLDEDVGE